MEVPGSNSGKFFEIFCAPFYPAVTALLGYLNPTILDMVGNFVITL